ncbi:MAG: transposase [Okeania sp. SIO3C4]|nr:transposase [Okeania sp. SIO3C4]
MKQIPDSIRAVSHKLRGLTSLIQTEYEELLRLFSVNCEAKLGLYTLKGKRRKARKYKEDARSSLYGSVAKLDFILMYLKEDTIQLRHGLLFELSQAKVSEWLHFLLPVLEQSLAQLEVLPQEGFRYDASQASESKWFTGDVTERPIARNVDQAAQKEEYSGKKKQHTVKNLVICDEQKRIVFLSDLYEGKAHDKTIWDALELELQGRDILLDLGFYGTEVLEAILPFKKRKNQELTRSQKAINRALAALRIGVEHAFGGV